MTRFILIFTGLFLTLPVQAQEPFRVESDPTIRLGPSAFSQLPPKVIDFLNRRKCTIPQSFHESAPHNVIRGQFAMRGQWDWAVLCSRGGASSILVFWNGSTRSVASFAAAKDSDYLQDIDGNGKAGYSRAIGVAEETVIRKRQKEWNDRRLGAVSHDGIEDIFVEKASIIKYFRRGRWREMIGAD